MNRVRSVIEMAAIIVVTVYLTSDYVSRGLFYFNGLYYMSFYTITMPS